MVILLICDEYSLEKQMTEPSLSSVFKSGENEVNFPGDF